MRQPHETSTTFSFMYCRLTPEEFGQKFAEVLVLHPEHEWTHSVRNVPGGFELVAKRKQDDETRAPG